MSNRLEWQPAGYSTTGRSMVERNPWPEPSEIADMRGMSVAVGLLGEHHVATIYQGNILIDDWREEPSEFFLGVLHLPHTDPVGEDTTDMEEIKELLEGELDSWLTRSGLMEEGG